MKTLVIFAAALLGIFAVIVVGETIRVYGYPGWSNIVSFLGLGLVIVLVIKALEKD
jgi:hypothetical protein